jgi:hypothetical protein
MGRVRAALAVQAKRFAFCGVACFWLLATAHSASSGDVDFRCLETNETIPRAYVNDDYCDCVDGSDETRTSACSHKPNAIFFCENVDWKNHTIPSSRVGDGICDCCDGSDENANRCPNACAALAMETLRQRAEEKRVILAGIEIRSAIIKEAYRQMSSWRSRLKDLEQHLKHLLVVENMIENKKYTELALERLEAEVLYASRTDAGKGTDASTWNQALNDDKLGYRFERDSRTGKIVVVKQEVEQVAPDTAPAKPPTNPAIHRAEDTPAMLGEMNTDSPPAHSSVAAAEAPDKDDEVIDLGDLEDTSGGAKRILSDARPVTAQPANEPSPDIGRPIQTSSDDDISKDKDLADKATPAPKPLVPVDCSVSKAVRDKYEGGERMLRYEIDIAGNKTELKAFLEEEPYVAVGSRREMRAKWVEKGSFFKLTGHDLASLLSGDPATRETDKHKLTPNYRRKHSFMGPIFNGGSKGWRRGLRGIFTLVGVLVSPVRLVYEVVAFTLSKLQASLDFSIALLPEMVRAGANVTALGETEFAKRVKGQYAEYIRRPLWRNVGLRLRSVYRYIGGPFAFNAAWEAIPELYYYTFPLYDVEYRRPSVQAVQKCLEQASIEKDRLEVEIKQLTADLGAEYGPHKTMYRLRRSCFSKEFSGYTYTVCPFHNITQDNTLLGKWHGFGAFTNKNPEKAVPGTKPGWHSTCPWYNPWCEVKATSKSKEQAAYRKWYFTMGDRCYQGMNRKAIVHASCGVDNELVEVTETDICVYKILLTTPALCDSKDLKAYEDVDPNSDMMKRHFSRRDEL